MKYKIYLLVIALSCLSVSSAWAQGTHTKKKSASGAYYWEYLPPGYNPGSSQKYPIMFFLHGCGEIAFRSGSSCPPGTTYASDPYKELDKLLSNGVPKEINNGRTMCFTVNGVQECFIVISPQLNNGIPLLNWDPNRLDIFIEEMKAAYPKADLNRLYVTGLSLGGIGTWQYTLVHPEKVAAIVPVSGTAGGLEFLACSMSKVPVWAFHDDPDPIVNTGGTLTMENLINACPGKVTPKVTLARNYAASGAPIPVHGIWGMAYSSDPSPPSTATRVIVERPVPVPDGLNVYQWMLGFTKNGAANNAPVVYAGTDATIRLPQNSLALNGSATDNDGTIVSYNWIQASGPTTATIQDAGNPKTTVSNLREGTYTFRLTAKDDDGATAADDVLVVELPALPAAQNTWNSYDLVMQASSQQAYINSNNAVQATLEFYQSANDFGVDKGSLLTTYNPGRHPNNKSNAEKYWAFGTGDTYPYAAESTVGRGGEPGEGNVPQPTGVIDLQMHPPNNNRLMVTAFIAPTSGTYTVSNLGARRTSSIGGTVRYRVFNQSKTQIANIQAFNNQDWSTSTATYSLGNLNAGDRIYFAVDRDGDYTVDCTEVTFTIQTGAANQAPVVNAGGDKSITLPQNSVALTGSATDADGTVVSYNWTQQSGPSTAAITNASSTTCTVGNLIAGTYIFRLTARDNGNATGYKDVTVTVQPATSVSQSWYSYDIAMQSTPAQQGVVTSSGGTKATVEFYESINDLGVDKGNLFGSYTSGNHPNAQSWANQYWTASAGFPYPFAGKSRVGRSYEEGEGSTPLPFGVMDLQLHPPNSNHLTVAAFIAPVSGTYEISQLGVRRVSAKDNGTVRFRVFNKNKSLVANLQATANQDWTTSTTTYSAGYLSAGERLYFATERDGSYASDFTEVTFAIKVIGTSGTRVASPLAEEKATALPEQRVSLYPNPVKDVLFVEGDLQDAAITVLSAVGQSVYQQRVTGESGKLEINTQALPAGMYIIKIETLRGVQQLRFIKE
jgi:predicted esterase